ncbi:GNAT family N-acetyltransferase [Nitrobacter hamburgensis]|uniref:GNAT family N-acetyltransferase n=1 Tax=Nitrobacter hamburgensis TaxID=912 RepID=UPI001FD915B5|nr:GNAT family N-acetyltransferase [Nitrobacter hamburgensis]
MRDAIEEAQLGDWQTQWQPALIKVLQELRRKGVPMAQWPQSWHWDWREKTARVQGFLAFPGFCIVCGGVTQGLMLLDLRKVAREPSQTGKPLVYVDYLEVAPWNRPDLEQRPQLKGVGMALLTAAIALSEQEGYRGRIGLHSLPQSEAFYRDRCRMSDLGPDGAYQNLRYFEMTAERARSFLGEE